MPVERFGMGVSQYREQPGNPIKPFKKESGLKRSNLICSGFLPRTLKGEVAKNQPAFRDEAKLIFSGGNKFCIFRPPSSKSLKKKQFLFW
ncbi:MAG: hypothetical protein R6U19_08910 [Bacteroidales bacterium]